MKKFFFIIVVAIIASLLWYKLMNRPVDADSQERITLSIDSGSSVDQIATLLEQKGVIRSPLAFVLFTRFHGTEGSLQAGKFIVRPSMSTAEVVEVLQNGIAEEMIITIPEGFTVQDIDQLLAEKGIIEAGEIIRCANECDFSSFEFLPSASGLAERGGKVEGYLYPDTYFISTADFVPKFFIERLLTTFRKKFVEVYAEDLQASSRSLHEIVTMASLIEEEAANDDERATISGILWNRFDAGLGLGVDATVRYILNKPVAAITTADLNTNSPYNTRKLRGLPPGAIANAGLQSLIASLKPKESEYWYYLHGNDGKIRYAKTNEEHNINKYNYLR